MTTIEIFAGQTVDISIYKVYTRPIVKQATTRRYKMAISNLFHKAAGSTQAVMNRWIKQREAADLLLEKQEELVTSYAKANNMPFKEAKLLFPSFKTAFDNYKFWVENVEDMRKAQKDALALW